MLVAIETTSSITTLSATSATSSSVAATGGRSWGFLRSVALARSSSWLVDGFGGGLRLAVRVLV
jgi:hypothetical protein